MASQRLAMVLSISTIRAQNIFFAHRQCVHRIGSQLIMIVEVFVAKDQPHQPLIDQLFLGVLNITLMTVIFKTVCQLGTNLRTQLNFSQKQAASSVAIEEASRKISRDQPEICMQVCQRTKLISWALRKQIGAKLLQEMAGLPAAAFQRSTMPTSRFLTFLLLLVAVSSPLAAQFADPISRRIPPLGIELKAEQRAQLQSAYDRRAKEWASMTPEPVSLKAVRLALAHGEFYNPKDVQKALRLLELPPETFRDRRPGLRVGQVVSRIDDSVQPYGLEISEGLDPSKPVPLFVWLHGRGDKVTDLHFIDQRLRAPGKIKVPDAIVLHPFGRQCIGWKHAGEIDVLDTMAEVQRHFNIDPARIVLMGFSMGGAGAWHIGAHHTDRFVAVSPGAGFAETREYNRLTPDQFPASYVQKLWGLYDTPNYVRNLFNLPVVAYSGENDKQIQAARVMERAFKTEGRILPHLIGPDTGHKYHPDTLAELLQRMKRAAATGQRRPQNLMLQTRTLRYARMHWLQVTRLHRHWEDSRVDIRMDDYGNLTITTRNVEAFEVAPFENPARRFRVKVDGRKIGDDHAGRVALIRTAAGWAVGTPPEGLVKRPGLQGPVDDAFLSPFELHAPAKADAWAEFELAHFVSRWRALFRGELRVKRDAVPDPGKHQVFWGTPENHPRLARLIEPLPVEWDADTLKVNGKTWDADHHRLVMIYPHPDHRDRYLVINSGITFREDHDRTNSQQNPKLPDWAVIDIRQKPDGAAPGKIVDAGFFDERWQFERSDTLPSTD